ncbi:unnamed protein product [Moneuplotes crassus]|uniref:Uncharacterized protein n=1 Tax=Euplotes crassus TaxID=5936 RepID=A0AAD2D712_EUPCR|nr:unnamed protein product [Moneuplotes crassus]
MFTHQQSKSTFNYKKKFPAILPIHTYRLHYTLTHPTEDIYLLPNAITTQFNFP